MIDASAMLEALLETPAGQAISARLFENSGELQAPHLIDLEVTNVLRRYAISRILATERCQQALTDFVNFPIYRHPHEHLLSRIWELRTNLSAYDAAYVALAETLGASLLTHDGKIARSAGHRVQIDLV